MKPSFITYTSIVQVLIKTKKIQYAIDIFDEILKNKINPDQVMFNVIINGCVFNGRLEDACRFLFESFKANLRLCNDVYKNIFKNLLTNRVMDPYYKNDLTLKICSELKSRGLEIDYDLYYSIMKMVYKTKGKNSEYLIEKELNEYKKSVNDYNGNNKNNNEKDYNYKKKDNYSNQKPRKYYNNYNNNYNKATCNFNRSFLKSFGSKYITRAI